MIAAPGSGSGKTTVVCGLLEALSSRGCSVCSCKCGPDYIDPMFHRRVLGVEAKNLDTFFVGEDEIRRQLEAIGKKHELVVMEGVMGLFDGVGGLGPEGSAYHLAQVTKTPVILVVDVHGMGRSMIPLIQGFLAYDREKLIRGVLLNRITPSFYETMKPVLDEELSVPVLGFLPKKPELMTESRHLGLVLPKELDDIREKLKQAGSLLERYVSLAALTKIAKEAEELLEEPQETQEKQGAAVPKSADESAESAAVKRAGPLRLAVARDDAFCFYYRENLELFEEAGVTLSYFSPLCDKALPDGCAGLLLGGGYPELYAKELSENDSMRHAVKEAIEAGMPSIAECGGFLYLHQTLEGKDGGTYPMAGVLSACAENKQKPVRFGYVILEEKTPAFLPAQTIIKGHEFHYYDSSENGAGVFAKKPGRKTYQECCHVAANHWWGFPHLYYPSNPAFVAHFVEEMKKWRGGG